MVFTSVLIFLCGLSTPDAVYLDYSADVTLHSDGTYTETTDIEVVPLNGRGVSRFSTIRISHREGMESIEIPLARVDHWRGGRGSSSGEISTGPHSILSATNRLESSLRETIVRMPGIEVGDTLRLTVIRRISRLPLSEVYSFSFSQIMPDSVFRSSFKVNDLSGGNLYGTQEGDSFSFSCVPPASDHPLAASPDTRITISTGTPNELSSEAWSLLDQPEHGDCRQLDEIVSICEGDPGRLREWVAENIDYTGADAGVWPGWSPRSPEETLDDRSGVCRDRALLLTWLLRKSGLEAYPALVSTTGPTPPLVDARYFDHMFTVYRSGEDPEWRILDPTPRGIPLSAGHSFGLRGCTYLPLTPDGSDLMTIPETGWNDSLKIRISAEYVPDEDLITGTLTASCGGVPLELVTKLYRCSDPALLEEMFRRFFGALSCDSVLLVDDTLMMTGTWRVRSGEGFLLLPGLRDLSHTGTRLASMLLPETPDSFSIDSPVLEVLELDARFSGPQPILPDPVSATGYSCSTVFDGGRVLLREYADITTSDESVLDVLLYRAGTSGKVLVLQ